VGKSAWRRPRAKRLAARSTIAFAAYRPSRGQRQSYKRNRAQLHWLALVVLRVVIGGLERQVKRRDAARARWRPNRGSRSRLGLIGIMRFGLGVMRLAERAGVVAADRAALASFMQRLFPRRPPIIPAMGSMLMNMAANMLGLGQRLPLRWVTRDAAISKRSTRIPAIATNADVHLPRHKHELGAIDSEQPQRDPGQLRFDAVRPRSWARAFHVPRSAPATLRSSPPNF